MDPFGLFDIDNVIKILNKDSSSQWVVCCLAARDVISFKSYKWKEQKEGTTETRDEEAGGSYHRDTKEIMIENNKNDVEAASTLIQECMHARDWEHKSFGGDRYNDMAKAYSTPGLSETEKMGVYIAWRRRREIAGRVYEEQWRINNEHGTKKTIGGSDYYEGGARANGKIDESKIIKYVDDNYKNLNPKNVTSTGSKWKMVPDSEKWEEPKTLDKKKFEKSCQCTKGPYAPAPSK